MKTKKILTGPEAGLTLEDLQQEMKDIVFQWRHAGKCLFEKGIYIRTRPYGRPADGGHPGAWDAWILTEDGVESLFYNVKYHRARIALKAYKEGRLDDVPDAVWENYIHNGWNTRTGLFRSAHKLERINEIARSHADFLGNETGNSTLDHEARVRMRN